MRRTVIALLATATLALAGCSAAGEDEKPQTPATATVTKAPELSAAEKRKACVDAWADAIQADADTDIDQQPAACEGLPEDDNLDRYMEGMQQRNKANRDDMQACLDDPTCTSYPVP
jgi:hypothetical protein